MHLMQIFVPTADHEGTKFPSHYYVELKQDLADRFGGITIYGRSPVIGIWKPDENSSESDDLIIFEVLTKEPDLTYFSSLKHRLEHAFKQDEILMRYFSVTLVK